MSGSSVPKPKSGMVVKPEQRSGKKLKWTCYECYSKYVECTHKKPSKEASMKSKRVQKRDEKLHNIIYARNIKLHHCNTGRLRCAICSISAMILIDDILKRVRAMGPKHQVVVGKTRGEVTFIEGFNTANIEWRRRLGGR